MCWRVCMSLRYLRSPRACLKPAADTANKHMKKAVLLSIGVGLLVAGLSVFIQTRGFDAQAFVEEPALASTTPQGSGTSFAQPAAPARLIIKAIGVNAA